MQDNLELNGHEVVIGRTQSGKTHYAINTRARAWPGPVLFFNPQGFCAGAKWIAAGGNDELAQIMRVLSLPGRNMCLNYVPNSDDEIAEKELEILIAGLFDCREKTLLVADEAQDFAGPLRRVARRGLARGLTGCFISQRPAEMHNTLLTQAVRHVIFASSWESLYFKRYGLDAEKIQALLSAAPAFSYVVVEQGEIKGPFRSTS